MGHPRLYGPPAELLQVEGQGTGNQQSFSGETDIWGLDDHPSAQTNAGWFLSVDLEELDLRCGIEETDSGGVYVPSFGYDFIGYCLF